MSSVTWRYLSGDTSVFAIELALVSDDVDDWMVDPDERASWGTIAVWVDGANAFEHTVQGEQLRAGHWYLLPIVEWLVREWDALLHEERLPGGSVARSAARAAVSIRLDAERRSNEYDDDALTDELQAWFERHRLRSGAPGALLPDLFVRRFGDLVELSSTTARPAGADWGVSFVPVPVVRVPVAAVAEPLFDAIGAFASRVSVRIPGSERLRVLREDIASLPAGERRDSRFAWLSGTGDEHTFRALWEQVEQAIAGDLRERFRAWSDPIVLADDLCLRATPVSLLFGSVSPSVESYDLVAILDVLLSAAPNQDALRSTRELRQMLYSAGVGGPLSPGEFGTLCGELVWSELHKQVDAEATGFVDVEAVLAAMGVPVRDVRLSDRSLRGVTALTEDGATAVVVNRSFRLGDSEAVRRFTLAHELAHLVLDSGRSVDMVVASGPWAPRDVEQRANAFAAALLMPSSLLDRLVRGDRWSIDDLRDTASRLRVSLSALVSRLQNLGRITPDEAEYLRDAAR